MNKKVLIIAITLVVLVAGVSFVSAGKQNPNADPSSTWTAINDLYAKVTALTDQVANIPAGPKGDPGEAGTDGADGMSCWDLNGDGTCNLDPEDVNDDDACTAADCQGPKGDTGATGATGPSGTCNIGIVQGEFENEFPDQDSRFYTETPPYGFSVTECASTISISSIYCPSGSYLTDFTAFEWERTSGAIRFYAGGMCKEPSNPEDNIAPMSFRAQYIITCTHDSGGGSIL